MHMAQTTTRTNSLAFAKTGCHTCIASEDECDRRRPICGNCIALKRICGGFALNLVWKAPTSADDASSPPRSGNISLEHRLQGKSSKQPGFKFVQGRAKRRRKTKQQRGNWSHLTTTFTQDVGTDQLHSSEAASAALLGPSTTTDIVSVSPGSRFPVQGDIALSGNGPDAPWDPSSFSVQGAGSVFGAVLDTNSVLTDLPPPCSPVPHDEGTWSIYAEEDDVEAWGTVDVNVVDTRGPDSNDYEDAMQLHMTSLGQQLSRISGVLYNDLSQKYGPVLTMYDKEFCVVPLSQDCGTNPFRVQTENIAKFPFLLHAILALSAQHLAKKNKESSFLMDMYRHRSTSLQLLSEALDSSDIIPLLDTILITIHLETSQTASSTWGAHLKGAQSVLERGGGAVEVYGNNSRMVAQIAMMVWWDVTIAFVSRREPRFPMAFLEMLQTQETEESWNFFVLSGCPIEFVIAMARLAKLAATYIKTTRMEWTIFNRFPVDLIMQEVKDYINEASFQIDDVADLDEDPNARRNRFHCIEAWRHAILLYAYRVFNPTQDAASLYSISHLSRVIVDSVRSIPQEEVLQKQLLLPIFLAGAEVFEQTTRRFVLEYCNHWSETSRLYHFKSAATLLEEVWRDASISTRSEFWWGVKVKPGADVQPHGEHGLDSELLFG